MDDNKDIMGVVFSNFDEAVIWKEKFDKQQESSLISQKL